jgi:hypothetical protein
LRRVLKLGVRKKKGDFAGEICGVKGIPLYSVLLQKNKGMIPILPS